MADHVRENLAAFAGQGMNIDPIDVSDLHAELGAKVRELEVKAAGIGLTFRKTSGARTFKHQAELYSAWRQWEQAGSRPPAPLGMVSAPSPMGVSRHHPYFEGRAAAVDLSVGDSHSHDQDRLIEIARAIGLRCGVDWGDRLHFELAKVGGIPLNPFAQLVRMGEALDEVFKVR